MSEHDERVAVVARVMSECWNERVGQVLSGPMRAVWERLSARTSEEIHLDDARAVIAALNEHDRESAQAELELLRAEKAAHQARGGRCAGEERTDV